jgi:hypothetical protein
VGLVAAQEVRWDKGDTEPADDYTFFFGNGNDNHTSAIMPKREQLVYDKMLKNTKRFLV